MLLSCCVNARRLKRMSTLKGALSMIFNKSNWMTYKPGNGHRSWQEVCFFIIAIDYLLVHCIFLLAVRNFTYTDISLYSSPYRLTLVMFLQASAVMKYPFGLHSVFTLFLDKLREKIKEERFKNLSNREKKKYMARQSRTANGAEI